jgi:hypothetical protein
MLVQFSRRREADQPEAATFQNFNLEEGQLADLMTIIKDKEKKQEQKNGMKPIKFWLTLG